MYPDHKLWSLAVSAVITELDDADHYWIGGYGPGPDTMPVCKKLLSDYYGIDSRDSAYQSLKYFYEQGDTAQALGILAALSDPTKRDNAKEKIVRSEQIQIQKCGLIAWDMARVVMVAGRSCWADYLSESEAWEWIIPAAIRVQMAFSSWREFAENYELGRLFWAEGKNHPATTKTIKYLLSDSGSLWVKLPWDTPLVVKLADSEDQAQSRMKKTICPGCRAPKTKPSLTAYVYCDYCGSLADYDFQKAKENPAAQPGPVYEKLLVQLQAPLAQAKSTGDKEAYFAAQEKLFGAWVDACPNAIPPRAKEKEYRKKYISYMARMNTLSAFDSEAQKYEAAINQAVAGLQWTMTDTGAYRVGAGGWEQLMAAFFPQQKYLEDLCRREGLYDQQPDGANEDIQKRIGYSLFVQGWLPMITEEQAQALLATTKLTGDYITVPTLADMHRASCTQCGAKLDIPDGAKRTVCEYCGFILDSASPSVPCPSCQASLTPTFDGTVLNCPYCATEIRRVN